MLSKRSTSYPSAVHFVFLMGSSEGEAKLMSSLGKSAVSELHSSHRTRRFYSEQGLAF